MAIGDPINAGIGSYDPSVNYFAQPQRRGAGLLSPSDLNLSTVPGQSQMDALNAIRERLGMRPLDQGLGSKFSIAPTGMTKGQAKQQQMTVGEYDIGRKLAALNRPNTMTSEATMTILSLSEYCVEPNSIQCTYTIFQSK